MIEFKNVFKEYISKKGTNTQALKNINLKIEDKGLLFIVGKSGSGKSTLLNLIGGLDKATSGEIIINGSNINNFSEKEYDSYRNTYIGFIFQEFNILEQYNIYENIELSIKLQQKQIEKSEIDELLKKLDITGLGKRKINELSGGQKQRVAIARALIKKPKIILADEPTGNLDSKSSKQIFNILKEISNEQLVIIVSHDMESAIKYADRIIEISDGEIIKDTKNINNIENKNIELISTKIPRLYALKMALSNLKAKPSQLILTTIIIAISLVFMGITLNCAFFEPSKFTSKFMKDNNNFIYNVYNIKYEKDYETELTLNNEDLKNIENKTNSVINPAYTLYDNEELLTFEFNNQDYKSGYFNNIPIIKSYVEIKDNRLLDNIIGSIPQKNNELIIHKYMAEYIIEFGIIDINNEIYQPKNINKLINDKHPIKLGSNEIYIVGVINDDNTLYKKALKSKYFETMELQQHFYTNYYDKSNTVYVKGFTENVKIINKDETIINKSHMIVSKKGVIGSKKTLNNPIKIMTTEGIKEINHLNKDEIIISIETLKQTDKYFYENFEEYLKNNFDKIYKDALYEFIEDYVTNKKVLDRLVGELYFRVNTVEEQTSNYVKIIGISFDDNNYISYDYVKEYRPINKEIKYVKIYDDDLKNLNKTFENISIRSNINNKSGIRYAYETTNYETIIQIIGTYKFLTIPILIVTLVFLIFTLLLFSNFINITISYCKKEIGILRAIGASKKDIQKIFGYEAIIIGIIAWIIAIIGWLITTHLINIGISSNYFYKLYPLVTHNFIPYGMIIYVLLIAIFTTTSSVSKLSKIRPIDAINNK